MSKLRKDLEECRIQHDATLVSLKKKQADSIAEVICQFVNLGWMHRMVLEPTTSSDVRADGSAEQDEVQVSKLESDITGVIDTNIFSG